MLYVVGDSLAVGMEPYLSRPAYVSARVGRPLSEGMSEIERIGARLRGQTLWVSLGTNDGGDRRMLRAMERTSQLVGPGGRVVWSTCYVRGASWGGSRSIRGYDARNERLRLVEWSKAVREGAVRLADGVHPGPAGYRYRARAYRLAAR